MADDENESGGAPGEESPREGASDVDVESEQAAAAPQRRGQRRRYEIAARDRLIKSHFSVGIPLTIATKVTLAGDAVTGTHGDAVWIGEAMARMGRLMAVLGDAAPQLAGLIFGNSVTFEFVPSDDEVERAETALLAAERRGTAPQDDDDTHRLLLRAVPDTTVGGEMAVELLESAIQDPVETALEYGTGPAQAYSSLAQHLATRDDARVVLTSPGRESVTLDSANAKRIRKALGELGERQPARIRAFGVLSMADAAKRRFALRLDREAAKHPILRGRSVVRGEYAPEIADKLRDEGLWNTEIRAVLRVEYNPQGGTSTVRPPSFKLVEADPRYS